MGKSKTTGKHRLDRFYHLAKEQGYRSRAAFKLVQLDAKYRFLSSSRALLDLCAAPGGWMQVAYKHMPVGSLIVGVDLVPIRPVRGALTLQEDITTPRCRASIRKLLKERGHSIFDVILHDGSPNVGGAWAKEATSQAALVLDSLKLATEFLAPKGTFVTKVFRSQDYNSLLYAFKQLFEKVEVTKPVASRSTSAEIYVICFRYRAPAKIDPRLLDIKHLFQDIAEPPQIIDVLRGTKQKRHREGYEEGNTTLRKECLASNFIHTEKPLELLGTITSISFNDAACTLIRDHALTTDEVKLLCEDLRVLGKQEFKQLLKWRLNVRKALSEVESVPASKIGTAEALVKDEDILDEMEELSSLMAAKRKREKKTLAKRRAKAKVRTATGMQVDVMEDNYAEGGLFSLTSIKGKKDLEAVESGGSSDEDTNKDDILNGSLPHVSNVDDSDLDSDVERQNYDAELEDYLDRAYERYRKSTDGSTKRRKRAKLGNADKELWEEKEISEIDSRAEQNFSGEAAEVVHASNPLVVPLEIEDRPSREQLAKQWFSQDIFAGFEGIEADHCAEFGKRKKKYVTGSEESSLSKLSGNGSTQALSSTNVAPEEDFEVVPVKMSDSDSSSDSSSDEDYDADSKAEILAYAKKMLRKKSREDILDDGYNKFTFNDEGLPDWFVDDEKRHCQPIKPVTKEDVEAMKAQFNAINTRPVKKVAEAKARKKRRALKKLEGIKQKVSAIADQPDMSSQSKKKMMERLYKKAETTNKPKKELIVAKKGMGPNGRKGKTIVDRRMKKDKRSHGAGKPGRKGKPAPAKKQRTSNQGKQKGNKQGKAKSFRSV
eukprot:c1554_g1_i1 orf=81-2570(+)